MAGVESCPAYLKELRDITDEAIGTRRARWWTKIGGAFRDRAFAAGRACEKLWRRSFCEVSQFLRRAKLREKLANSFGGDGLGGDIHGAVYTAGRACEELRKGLFGAVGRCWERAKVSERFSIGFQRDGTGGGSGSGNGGDGGGGGAGGDSAGGRGGGSGRSVGETTGGSSSSSDDGGSTSGSSSGSRSNSNRISSSRSSDSRPGGIGGSRSRTGGSDDGNDDDDDDDDDNLSGDDGDDLSYGGDGCDCNDNPNQNATDELAALARTLRKRHYKHGNSQKDRILAAQRVLGQPPSGDMKPGSFAYAGGCWALIWIVVGLIFYYKKAGRFSSQATQGSARERGTATGKGSDSLVGVRGKG